MWRLCSAIKRRLAENRQLRRTSSTAAISGLRGGVSVKPPRPRPSMMGTSPARKPLRSIPDGNTPSLPDSTPTLKRSSPSPGDRGRPRSGVLRHPSMALRLSGLLMVITRRSSQSPMRTVSAVTASFLFHVTRQVRRRAHPLRVTANRWSGRGRQAQSWLDECHLRSAARASSTCLRRSSATRGRSGCCGASYTQPAACGMRLRLRPRST